MVTILAALAAGCARVIVSDVHEPKLDIARKLGPVETVNVRSRKLTDAVMQASDGWGADVVFECSGYAPAAAEMFDVLCPGGRVVLVGIPLEPLPFDVSKAQVKEARIENVFRYAHVYPRAVAMLASGKIDVTLADHRRLPVQGQHRRLRAGARHAADLGQGADRDGRVGAAGPPCAVASLTGSGEGCRGGLPAQLMGLGSAAEFATPDLAL